MTATQAAERIDRNDLAYWFPLLEGTGVRVPRTRIVTTEARLLDILEGGEPTGFSALIDGLHAAAQELGYPVFLRTGHTSGKHGWKETCYVAEPADLPSHVMELVEYSALADLFGLPTETWVVRELLQLDARFHAFPGEMPIAREHRLFIRDGEVICRHPYWPAEAIEDHDPSCEDWREQLDAMNRVTPDEADELEATATRVAEVFTGFWSVDIAALVEGGWVVTDMAEGARSWHAPECPHAQGRPPR
jgi:hypothetical protein